MQVIHRRVEEEEQPEMKLQRPEAADTTSSSSESSEEEVHHDALSPKSVYLDKNEDLWKCHHCIWTHKNGHSSIHHFHQKPFIQANRDIKLQWSVSGKSPRGDEADISRLVNAVINHEVYGDLKGEISSVSTTKIEEGNVSTRSVASDIVGMEESDDDDDEIELEFERAVDKLHTHTPYCPNCSNQITKVILRRKKRRNPRADKPLDLLGCLSCFSIFIPSGDCLDRFNLFGSRPKVERPNVGDVQPSSDIGSITTTTTTTTTNAAAGKAGINPFNCFGSKPELESPKLKDPSIDVANSSMTTTTTTTTTTANAAVVQSDSNYLSIGKREGYQKVESSKPAKTQVKEEAKQETPTDQVAVDIEPAASDATIHEGGDVYVNPAEQPLIISGPRRSNSLEILKCIVYGGLIASVASLSVVSSAAASDTATANVITIGLATLISGLIAFFYNLVDLRNEVNSHDKYQELLGMKGHFLLHSTFAIFSYLVFGLVAPITYAFAFRESDNKDYKIISVAAAGFACVFILAIAKAYVRGTDKFSGYVKTILYYVSMAVSASGVAYAAGDLIGMLMNKYGWFEPVQEVGSLVSRWASY